MSTSFSDSANSSPSKSARSRSKSAKQSSQLRTAYNLAARAFLLRDYRSAIYHLDEALGLLESYRSSEVAKGQDREDAEGAREWWDDMVAASWENSTVAEDGADIAGVHTGRSRAMQERREKEQIQDQARKITILRFTLLATVHPSSAPATSSKAFASSNSSLVASLPASSSFIRLIPLPAPQLLSVLWHSLLPPPAPISMNHSILPCSAASFIHPSVITALTLAALKVGEPIYARRIAEAWLDSAALNEEMGEFLFEVTREKDGDAAGADFRWEDYPLSSLNNSNSLSSSTLLSNSTPNLLPPTPVTVFIKSYLNLFTILTLSILPQLEEFDSAREIIGRIGVVDGGWVGFERIQATLAQLEQIEHTSMEQALFRQKQEATNKAAEAQRELERKAAIKKGKAASSTSHTSSSHKKPSSPPALPPAGYPNSSPSSSKSSQQQQNQSFSTLRTTLSSYLAQTPSTSTIAPSSANSSNPSLSKMRLTPSTLLKSILAQDPLRIFSLICALLAIGSWYRRRRLLLTAPARGAEGTSLSVGGFMRLVGTKVVETIKMGGKVSSL